MGAERRGARSAGNGSPKAYAEHKGDSPKPHSKGSAQPKLKFNRWWILKSAVFLACSVPIAWLLLDTLTGNLTANPLEDIRDRTGIWTLRFLMITLAVTPLRRLTGWSSLIRFRRMLGLFSFFYGFVHLATYVWLDQYFDFNAILKDMFLKRPFIITGFLSFLALIPLAVTSTRKWIGRLGGSRWQLLHRLIYFSTAAGILHYYWRGKVEIGRTAAYAALLAVLLAFRLWHVLHQRRSHTAEMKAV
jgi:sulfoxide reductase heme-binding subunit YedZ